MWTKTFNGEKNVTIFSNERLNILKIARREYELKPILLLYSRSLVHECSFITLLFWALMQYYWILIYTAARPVVYVRGFACL